MIPEPNLKNKELLYSITIGTVLLVVIYSLQIIILAPLPVLYFCFKFDRYGARIVGLSILFITLVILALIFYKNDPDFLMLYIFQCVAPTILLGEAAYKTKSFSKTVLYASIFTLLFYFSFIVFYVLNNQVDFFTFVGNYIEKATLSSGQILGTNQELVESFSKNKERIVKIIPSLIVIITTFTMFLNSYIAYKKFKTPFLPENLKSFRIGDQFIWLFIASLALFTLSFFTKNTNFDRLSTNIFVIFAFIYFFQGLSVATFYIEKLKTLYFLKIIIYILLFLHYLLVIVIGVVDFFVDFRKLKANK